MSTRQAILTELLNRVSAIQVEHGYATDAGVTVFFGESPMLGPDDPTSAIALIVGDDQIDPASSLEDDILTRLPIDITAIAKADIVNPWATVEAVIADIKLAIETPDRTLGGLLTRGLQRGRTRSLDREPGATSIGAAIQYAATYLDAWGNSGC